MNASTLVKYSGLLVSCFLLLATVSCKKSSLENLDPEDPGYGCNSNVVLGSFSNTSGLMYYNPVRNVWTISTSLYTYGTKFEVCDPETIQTVVASHTLDDRFMVVLSGNIKRWYKNQVIPADAPFRYPVPYFVDVTAIVAE